MDKDETPMSSEQLLHHIHKDVNSVKKMIKHGHNGHKEHEMNASNTDYISSGGAGGFGGGVGGFGLLGLFGILGANGLNGGNDGKCVALEQTIATLQGQNSSTTAILAGLGSVKDSLGAALGGVSEAICQANYNNSQQTSQILTAMTAGFTAAEQAACARAYADIERQLAVAQSGGPRVQNGVWVQPNPCPQNNGGDMVNQTIIQIGNRLTAIEGALRTAGK